MHALLFPGPAARARIATAPRPPFGRLAHPALAVAVHHCPASDADGYRQERYLSGVRAQVEGARGLRSPPVAAAVNAPRRALAWLALWSGTSERARDVCSSGQGSLRCLGAISLGRCGWEWDVAARPCSE